jgi:hypothetical protein
VLLGSPLLSLLVRAARADECFNLVESECKKNFKCDYTANGNDGLCTYIKVGDAYSCACRKLSLQVARFDDAPFQYRCEVGGNLGPFYPGVFFGPDICTGDARQFGLQACDSVIVAHSRSGQPIRVDFQPPVNLAATCYSTLGPSAYMDAYDANGTLIWSDTGQGNHGIPGDLEIFSESRLISYVYIYSSQNAPLAIDRFRWAVQGPVNDYVLLNCGILSQDADSITVFFDGGVMPNHQAGEWPIRVAQLFNGSPWGDEHVALNTFLPLAACPVGPPCPQPVPPPCGQTVVTYKGAVVHRANATCENWEGLGCLCTYPIFTATKRLPAPPGPGTLSIVLDPHHEYPESDETNNQCDFNYNPVSGVNPADRPPAVRLGLLSPNPSTSGRIGYSIDLDRERSVDLLLVDPGGRIISRLFSGALPSGHHVFSWAGVLSDGGRLHSGVYYLTLQAEGVRATRMLVITK